MLPTDSINQGVPYAVACNDRCSSCFTYHTNFRSVQSTQTFSSGSKNLKIYLAARRGFKRLRNNLTHWTKDYNICRNFKNFGWRKACKLRNLPRTSRRAMTGSRMRWCKTVLVRMFLHLRGSFGKKRSFPSGSVPILPTFAFRATQQFATQKNRGRIIFCNFCHRFLGRQICLWTLVRWQKVRSFE